MDMPGHVGIVSAVPSHLPYLRVLMQIFRESRITLVLRRSMLDSLEPDAPVSGQYPEAIPFPGAHPHTPDIRRRLAETDMIVFDEMFTLPELAAFSRRDIRGNDCLTVHNCNSWFSPRYSLFPRQSAAALLRTAIRRKARNIIVMGSALKAHLEAQNTGHRILFVPDYFPEGPPPRDSAFPAGGLRIAVPGGISRRRDYDAILDAVCRPEFREALALVLLGSPAGEYGRRIVGRCRALRADGYDIAWSESYIPRAEFDRELGRADILLSVFDIRYPTIDRQVEFYGLTKVTALGYLSLAHGKPAILPAAYRAPRESASQIIPFRNVAEIPGILERMLADPAVLGEYRAEALRNIGRFPLEPIREQFRRF